MMSDDELRSVARALGARLETDPPKVPVRRRVRRVALIAIALMLGAGAFIARPRDPAAAIESAYAGRFAEVRIEDPELRREFEAALAQVERAIALAKDAVRRSPGNTDFSELCHVAFQAKVRLIQAYIQGS